MHLSLYSNVEFVFICFLLSEKKNRKCRMLNNIREKK